MKWLPIEDAADIPVNKAFVAIAVDVIPPGLSLKYTTDPYCVWNQGNGDFARWPHPFPPTHFCRLPDIKEKHMTYEGLCCHWRVEELLKEC
jgi:hypothetical protein